MPTTDVIGDIHDYADRLRRPLSRLGGTNKTAVSTDRRSIFVGHLIDRGPAIGEVMKIAAGMLRRSFRADCHGQPRIQRAVFSHTGREGGIYALIQKRIVPKSRKSVQEGPSIKPRVRPR
jgi:hypothetical protein